MFLTRPLMFFLTAQTEKKADRHQEVQKGSWMEVHLGPDPPRGGWDPGLCQLCK